MAAGQDSKLIAQLGECMFDAACRDLAGHPAAAGVDMHFDVTPRQLLQPGFAELLLAVLRRTGRQPNRLTLAIAESAFADTDCAALAAVIRALNAKGIRIAIDSFGTGYCSLDYLEQLPIDSLKIDGGFVAKLKDCQALSASLAASIIEVGRALGMDTIAEGVETPAQHARLLELGCRRGQGPLFGAPASLAAIDFSSCHG
jgi:EAL domain-containing protein (putative c-di-GMP-specific phosphodiesterase class I)